MFRPDLGGGLSASVFFGYTFLWVVIGLGLAMISIFSFWMKRCAKVGVIYYLVMFGEKDILIVGAAVYWGFTNRQS